MEAFILFLLAQEGQYATKPNWGTGFPQGKFGKPRSQGLDNQDIQGGEMVSPRNKPPILPSLAILSRILQRNFISKLRKSSYFHVPRRPTCASLLLAMAFIFPTHTALEFE
jgi:hypothetical protein